MAISINYPALLRSRGDPPFSLIPIYCCAERRIKLNWIIDNNIYLFICTYQRVRGRGDQHKSDEIFEEYDN